MADMPGGTTETASGAIHINVTQVTQAAREVANASAQMQASLDRLGSALQVSGRSAGDMGQATEMAGQQLSGFTSRTNNVSVAALNSARAFNQMRWGLLGIAGATAVGIAAVTEIEAMSIGLEALGTSMEEIRAISDRMGLPFMQLASGARQALPTVRATNADLEKTLLVLQQLATLNPAQGITSAGVALAEFMNRQVRPLAMRFNLAFTDLNRILTQAGGDVNRALELLSQYLSDLGISSEVFDKMRERGVYAFQTLRDEVKLLLSEAFGPVFEQTVLPAVRSLTDFVRTLAETSPTILKTVAELALLVSGIAAVTAVLGPLVNVIVGFATVLNTVGGMAFVGVLGTLAGAGALVAGMTGKTWGEGIVEVVVIVVEALGELAAAIMEVTNIIVSFVREHLGLIPPEQQMAQSFLEILEKFIVDLRAREGKEPSPSQLADVSTSNERFIKRFMDEFTAIAENTGSEALRKIAVGLMDSVRKVTDQATAEGRVLTERDLLPMFMEFRQELDELATGAVFSRDAIETVRNIRQAIEELIASLGMPVKRLQQVAQETTTAMTGFLEPTEEMLEAFAKFQEDMAGIDEKLQRDLDKMREDFAIREQRDLEDHQDRIDDIRKRAEEQMADDENRAQRERVRRMRNYLIDLLEAASRLDAFAVRSILRRMAEDQQREDEDAQERKAKREKDMADRIAQEERDYAKRRQRALEDHQRRERDAIESAERERQQRIAAFNKLYNDLAIEAGWHNATMIRTAQLGYEALKREFDNYLNEMGVSLANLRRGMALGTSSAGLTTSLSTGYYTPGTFWLDQQPYVAPITQPASSAYYTTSTTPVSQLYVQPGAITVNGTNLTQKQLEEAVVNGMYDYLQWSAKYP